MPKINEVLLALSAEELAELARLANTSTHYLLYGIAKGRRGLTVEKAAELEEAAFQLHMKTGGRTPLLDRRKVCETCSLCPHGAQAPGGRDE